MHDLRMLMLFVLFVDVGGSFLQIQNVESGREPVFFITNQAWDIEKWSGENCRSTWDVVCNCNQNTFLCSILMNYGGFWPRKNGRNDWPSPGAGAAHLWDRPEDPHGSYGAGPKWPKVLILLVQLRWSSGILQDGAENMEKNTKKTDFNGKEKRD